MKAVPKGYRKNMSIVASDAIHTQLLQAKSGLGEYLLDTVDGGGYTFAGHNMYTEPQADQSGICVGIARGDGRLHGGPVRSYESAWFCRMMDDPLNPQFVFATWLSNVVVDANALVSLKMGT